MKHLILCADDYGQNTSISQAIISLLEKKRLSAVSCLSSSYYWPRQAEWLKPFINQVDIGLHFNLTEGKPLSKEMGAEFTPLPQLITRAYLKRLDPAVMEAELSAQLKSFVQAVGRLPDFIDGHQHIHQLPIVRDVILSIYEKKLRPSEVYVRNVNMPSHLWQINRTGYAKKILIQCLGSFQLKKLLEKHNVPHNSSFSGAYHFDTRKNYADLFKYFLAEIHDQGIIMCHPGFENRQEKHEGDTIYPSRHAEYEYLQSEAFVVDCVEAEVMLSRFSK